MRKLAILLLLVFTFSLCSAPAFATIYINEIVPNPTDDCLDCTEWMELYNDGDEAVDVANWMLKDSKDKFLIILPDCTEVNLTIIAVGGFLVINAHSCNNTQFKLRNEADTIRLISDGAAGNDTIVDEASYSDFDSSSSYDKAWARIPDGSEEWVKIASTHSESNKAPEEDVSDDTDAVEVQSLLCAIVHDLLH